MAKENEFIHNLGLKGGEAESALSAYLSLSLGKQAEAIVALQKAYKSRASLSSAEWAQDTQTGLGEVLKFVFDEVGQRLAFWENFRHSQNEYQEEIAA